ncbi:hypothetical protein [Flavivirga rizhaonensis]|uniref:Uncharacterized protein n=1 Tax=Flavivirga rizhaonensis TaxID=2559571 RepID=A0A4S1E415_9FLAO|nr:hypothetical protein [Flavivirga rizhaonensis]TGV04818.1 hypothetical protein EM932_01480 [Flavivirga rizhaonensis]
MNKEDTRTATDPFTGETFIKSRSNQVFASRENQVKHNNLKAYNKRKAKNEIDKILDKNRQVLMDVLGTNNEIVKSLDYLHGAGFHFGCSTHTINRDGSKWVCIYDYAYSMIDTNTFKIIKLTP